MRSSFWGLVVASALALSHRADAQVLPGFVPAPPSHQAEVCGHAASEIDRWFRPGAHQVPEWALRSLVADNTDVLHYNLNLEIVPSTTTLVGTNVMTVRCTAGGVSTITIQLHQNFGITSLTVNGVAVTSTRLDVANLRVNLDHVYALDEQFDLAVSYSGVPVSLGFGSMNFTTHGASQPLIFTLSEPYYAYTWWPVKEDNTDKATADLAFVVPNTLIVASNGTLQGTDAVAGGKLRYRWRTDYQTAPYLFCFSAANYNQFSDTWTYPGGTMPMEFYIYPEQDTTPNRNAWKATNQMLTTFSNLYGLYAFRNEKYGIYNFGFGGGMEHQTMTGQGTFSESVTAHELSHQWWGDKVTCANWGHIWLNEGFATYSEALWLEFKPGSSGTAALLSAMSSRRPTSFNVTVFRADTSSAGVIFDTNSVYRKGGWALHMLRHVIGDSAFFAALNDYNTQYAYATATTEDFQAVCETHYGGSLQWFFQEWIYQPGAPTYQNAFRSLNVNGSNYLEVYLRQTQSAAYPIYAMPIDLVATIGGSPTTIKVNNDAATEYLLVPVSGAVTALSIDPNNYILRGTTTTTAFVEGPPKIVAVSPAPGSGTLASGVANLQVTFHRNVNTTAGDYALVGANTGAVATTFAYSPATLTTTLTPLAPLPADSYTLTVSASVTNAIGGASLDGEIANPSSPASLPSGNGQAGGAATFAFTITPLPCAADITGDHTVSVADLLAVIAAWGPCANCVPPSNCPADVAPVGALDCQVNVTDLLAVISSWGACP